ncbi:GNAT family N-acetyltransferase [Bacillus sp. 179-C3.3 HS]|uniref:GNAT family N-acetyltransferase n=1 Tax=Bacillus sp. 179-C3.3 HS TaxID=3232162 RepID=UPI0039A00165
MKQQEIHIREAGSQDHDAIRQVLIKSYAQFEPQFTEEGWQNYAAALKGAVDNPNMELMLVAELEEKVVGTLQMFRSSEKAYDKPELGITSPIIRFLGVDPDVRGKGIAELLLRKSIELTQAWGENVLYLHTSDKMQAAIRLYERMGFERALDKEFVNQNGTHVKSYQYVMKKEQPASS